jgi:hypothetical protein
MTKNQAKEYILERFVDNIGATPYTFANDNYDPPVSSEFVHFEVIENFSYQESLGVIGNRKYEREGIIRANIFTPVNTGTTSSDSIATTIRTVFEGVSFDGIRCFDAIARDLTPDATNPWFQQIVEIEYQYTNTK